MTEVLGLMRVYGGNAFMKRSDARTAGEEEIRSMADWNLQDEKLQAQPAPG